MKKTAVIIGAGISGLSLAIFIRRNNPNIDVIVIEKNSSILKRIRASGNGKCNFANVGPIINKYDNEDDVLPIIKEFGASKIIAFFNSLGIKELTKEDLVYPFSETSLTVILMFYKQINNLGIAIKLDESFLSYSKDEVTTTKDKYSYDYLIFSCGGVANPTISDSTSVLNILHEHGYEIIKPTPCLVPLKVKENVHLLDGLRVKGRVSLFIDDKLIHKEDGEIQFKDEGLGGIAINNMSFYIPLSSKNVSIHIDFLLGQSLNGHSYDSFIHPTLVKYLIQHQKDITKCVFHFKNFYGFDIAHVSKGGVSFKNVSASLESKIEKNIFFTGEILDTCGVCGGYNIMWAIASSYHVSKNIK